MVWLVSQSTDDLLPNYFYCTTNGRFRVVSRRLVTVRGYVSDRLSHSNELAHWVEQRLQGRCVMILNPPERTIRPGKRHSIGRLAAATSESYPTGASGKSNGHASGNPRPCLSRHQCEPGRRLGWAYFGTFSLVARRHGLKLFHIVRIQRFGVASHDRSGGIRGGPAEQAACNGTNAIKVLELFPLFAWMPLT